MLTMFQVLRATDTDRDTSSTDPTTQSKQCQVAVKMLGGVGTEGGGWQDPDSETLPSEGETPEDKCQTEVYFSQCHRGCTQRGWKGGGQG